MVASGGLGFTEDEFGIWLAAVNVDGDAPS